MAKEMKAADLIGKVLVLGGGSAKYVIKGAEGDKLQCEFIRGDSTPVNLTMPMSQIETILNSGKGAWEGDASDTETKTAPETNGATATDDVEEVTDVQPQKPKKKDPTPTLPKGGRKKAKDVKPETCKPETKSAKLTYSTYTNKKGKTCAKIIGFGENDAAYVNAADLHGSATYERDKDGNKEFYLAFGPKYAAAAKEVCDALNAGKSFDDCQAIIDKATEERAAKRDEWKAKREERKAAAAEPKGKVYTEAEVADLLKRVIAGDAEAMRIVNEMQKAA